MNVLKYLIPRVTGYSKSTVTAVCSNRTFSSLRIGRQHEITPSLSQILPASVSQAPFIQVSQPCRTYMYKDVLKRRCPGCYFVKKFDILHVECDLKPRHKQVQKLRGAARYKDDYSKGKWKTAVQWGWMEKSYYKSADKKFVKYDWLEGKIGTKV